MEIEAGFERAYKHYESFVKAAIKNSEHLEVYLRDTTKLNEVEKDAIRRWLAEDELLSVEDECDECDEWYCAVCDCALPCDSDDCDSVSCDCYDAIEYDDDYEDDEDYEDDAAYDACWNEPINETKE